MSAAETGSPVRNGTSTVAPNMANRCCELRSSHWLALGRSPTSRTGSIVLSYISSFSTFSSIQDPPLFADDHFVHIIVFFQIDAYLFVACRRNILPGIIRPDRQLPVAAVDQDCKGYFRWPHLVQYRIHRRPDGAACIEHVIDDDHMSAVKQDIDVHRILQCIGIRLLVIPVGCNIQCACRNRDAVYLLDFLLKPVGQELSSRFDPEEYEPLCPFIPLQYLMGYARQRSCDLCFIQNRPLFHFSCLLSDFL